MTLVEVNALQVSDRENGGVRRQLCHRERRNLQPDRRIRLREIDYSARAGGLQREWNGRISILGDALRPGRF
jgi:peptide/nickel transport system ATP-binding protein